MDRSLSSCVLAACVALVSYALPADDVYAQSSSLFGSRGPVSQSGSRATGRVTTASPSLTGASRFGQSTTGTVTGSRLTTTNLGQGFTGRGDSATQFVGNRLAGQGSAQQTSTNSFRQLGNQRSQLSRLQSTSEANRLRNQTDQKRRVIRPRQEIAFAFPKLSATAINNSLQARVEKLDNQGLAIRGVTWAIDEKGLVIIRGEVESERTKKLAELMVRLEPGVRTVQNDLVVKAGRATE